jgi:hypothetical protein
MRKRWPELLVIGGLEFTDTLNGAAVPPLPSHLISMAGLQAPLSTLRRAPRDALRITRGQFGLLFLSG